MTIHYKNKKLQKQLTEPKELFKNFGQIARKINQRIDDLKAADNLEVMRYIPGARCHELKGKRKNTLAVDVSANYRIVFEPMHTPVPLNDDGGLCWVKITEICIIEVVDYH